MEEKKLNIRGLIGTIIFHGIIVLVLLMFGFTTPLPLPEEQGILVAFGNTEQGHGNTEATLAKNVKNNKEKKKTNTLKASSVKETTKKILTQDFEDAPSIKSGKNKIKKKRKPKKKLTDKEKRERKNRANRKKKERLERERIRRKQAELIRLEKESILAEKAKQAKIANINNKAKSMFGRKSGDNSGNSGNTSGTGNMGKISGSLEGNYSGLGNNGVAYSLTGRSATKIIKPQTSFQKSGKVVVTIYVNQLGKVTRATAGARGTTTHDNNLHKLAEKAALKTTFNTNRTAAAIQKGTITYIFIVK